MFVRVPAVCAVLLLLCSAVNAFAISVRDDSGRTVSIAHPAQRIVTLAPNLTELVFDLGAGDRVRATVQFSNYPVAAKRIPRIGRSGSLNLEAMLGYRPDLVLAWLSGNNPQQLETIERLGIPVYRSEPKRLQDIPLTLAKLGKLLGRERQAAALSRQMHEELQNLHTRFSGRRVLSGFYQIWDRPIYTVNGSHIISNIMQLCGIRNIFSNNPVLAPTVSRESVIAKNPQIIISGGSANDVARVFAQWRNWPQLTAVHAHNLFHIDADLMQRDTPRIIEGAGMLCRQADIARRHLNLQ